MAPNSQILSPVIRWEMESSGWKAVLESATVNMKRWGRKKVMVGVKDVLHDPDLQGYYSEGTSTRIYMHFISVMTLLKRVLR